jgi:hypothetical protein
MRWITKLFARKYSRRTCRTCAEAIGCTACQTCRKYPRLTLNWKHKEKTVKI